jgi:protein TonB
VGTRNWINIFHSISVTRVNEEGAIQDVKTIQDIGHGCGQEAERVVKSMPHWYPGRKEGKAIPVSYRLPVVFELPGNTLK